MNQIPTDYSGDDHQRNDYPVVRWMRNAVLPVSVIGVFAIVWPAWLVPSASANHQGRNHAGEDRHGTTEPGHAIPGASFEVFLAKGAATAKAGGLDQAQADATVQTVVDAFRFMVQHRTDYQRFDEALKKDLLEKVIIEPTVVNQEGKTFPIVVARTKDPGRVKLLISGSSLNEKGYLNHPDQLVPVLAREFQWVVSKADTSPKTKTVAVERDLKHARIRSDKEVQEMPGDERARILQELFGSYLKTIDDHKSLEGQSYYEVGTTTLVSPTQSDSTTKLYDIRSVKPYRRSCRMPISASTLRKRSRICWMAKSGTSPSSKLINAIGLRAPECCRKTKLWPSGKSVECFNRPRYW